MYVLSFNWLSILCNMANIHLEFLRVWKVKSEDVVLKGGLNQYSCGSCAACDGCPFLRDNDKRPAQRETEPVHISNCPLYFIWLM